MPAINTATNSGTKDHFMNDMQAQMNNTVFENSPNKLKIRKKKLRQSSHYGQGNNAFLFT